LTVAVPAAGFVLALKGLHTTFVEARETLQAPSLLGTAALVGLAIVCGEVGTRLSSCLVILMLGPVSTAVTLETVGDRSLDRAMPKT